MGIPSQLGSTRKKKLQRSQDFVKRLHMVHSQVTKKVAMSESNPINLRPTRENPEWWGILAIRPGKKHAAEPLGFPPAKYLCPPPQSWWTDVFFGRYPPAAVPKINLITNADFISNLKKFNVSIHRTKKNDLAFQISVCSPGSLSRKVHCFSNSSFLKLG